MLPRNTEQHLISFRHFAKTYEMGEVENGFLKVQFLVITGRLEIKFYSLLLSICKIVHDTFTVYSFNIVII